jgi:hypothetical protein
VSSSAPPALLRRTPAIGACGRGVDQAVAITHLDVPEALVIFAQRVYDL